MPRYRPGPYLVLLRAAVAGTLVDRLYPICAARRIVLQIAQTDTRPKLRV
jgi:hypothetical protein